MKQTNYQLFDFLDFDTSLSSGERLWRACRPTDIQEINGDIIITVPFQQQNNSNEITEDKTVARIALPLRLRAYGDKVMRMSLAFQDAAVHEDSPMLDLADEMKPQALTFEKADLRWTVKDAQGRTRALVNFEMPVVERFATCSGRNHRLASVSRWKERSGFVCLRYVFACTS